jgi:class 3 adenylate cyclase
MGAAGIDELTAARAAFDAHRWSEAFEAFQAADKVAPLEAADLERLANAARWSRHFSEILGAFERAEAAYSAAGDSRGAARAALQLAWEHYQRDADAASMGWFQRAGTSLGTDTECGEYGLFLALWGLTTFGNGDFQGARELLVQALETAQRAGDRDAEGLARMWLGHALVNSGEEAAGLAMVDEANAGAVSGALGVQAAGSIYCSTIFLCRNRGDWRRAQEWTEASLRWCERESVSGFPGLCRFHRAEVMRFRGALAEAEQDALDAADELLAAAPRFAGWAFHELGEIRRRRGDRSGALKAFGRASELGFDPQPGLALLRLDEGDVAGARTAIHRALAEVEGLVQESRGLLLPAAVTIELAAGDPDAAGEALAELEVRAGASGTPAFAAAVSGARGEIALAEGRADEAVPDLRRAFRGWSDVDAPFEAAQARVLLAQAYRVSGADADATLELEGARAAFERIGADREAARVGALLVPQATGSRTVRTFVFTDIVDSTRFLELLGDEGWDDLLQWHDRTLRSVFAEHGGQEVKHEGDGFFVAFIDSTSALECACGIQRSLAAHRREHGFAPQVRIGVHAAEASERDGDFHGKGVHTAARVGAAAVGGEILTTRAALDGAGDRFSVSEPRPLALKGLAEPVEVATVDWQAASPG